jgi:hypothetical protein
VLRSLATLALGLAACSSTLDVDRARHWFDTPNEPAIPELKEATRADIPAPEQLRATSGELREVPLAWDPLLGGDVAGYVVERAELREGPFERIAAIPGRAQTTYLDLGKSRWPGAADGGREALPDGETFFYRVRAFSSAGAVSNQPSALVAATTAPPPAPPEELRAYSHQPRQVPLSWRASPDPHVAGYVVRRSPTSRGPFEPLAEIEGRHQTVYLDQRLGDLRVFHYRVASVNRYGGQGDPSKPVRAVTKPEPLPPVGLRVVARRLGANELAWDPNVETDLAGYRLLRQREGGKSPELVTALKGGKATTVDPMVAADELVSYTLVAYDDDGLESAPAEPIAVQSVGYELSAAVGRDGLELRWNPRRDEGWRGARVFLHGTFGQTELGFVEAPPFRLGEAKPGRRYRFSVVLERADGTRGPVSSPVEIRVPKR